MGALDNVLVVALEQAVAAPLATLRLAEAGARVIKIERAQGDFARAYDHVVAGESAYFVWLNRGKESLVLDIKDAADARLLRTIVARADIFIQNLAPDAAARAGFGSAALRARHPRLITCDISGYGDDGPYRDMKAYDFLIQCETGLASITGGVNEPGRVGVSVADIGCGMNAHAAILQALYERQVTGRGAGIAVSLFDGIADWMSVPLLHHEHAGAAPGRVGLHHATIAPYGAYAVAGGTQVILAVQNEREWRSLCLDVLGRPALVDDPRFATNPARCAHREALDEALGGALDKIDEHDAVARLAAAGIAFARFNRVTDLSTHPQLRRSSAVTKNGPISLPASPVRWSGEGAGTDMMIVPSIGQQSASIREEFESDSKISRDPAWANWGDIV